MTSFQKNVCDKWHQPSVTRQLGTSSGTKAPVRHSLKAFKWYTIFQKLTGYHIKREESNKKRLPCFCNQILNTSLCRREATEFDWKAKKFTFFIWRLHWTQNGVFYWKNGWIRHWWKISCPPRQNHTSPELISLDLLQDVRTTLTAEKAVKPAERAFQAAMPACLGRSTEVNFDLSPAQFW